MPPVISGNGRDVIRINGQTLNYQGMAHVKRDLVTELAVDKTKGNGLDEYYVNVKDDYGRTQRIIVYGDRLDFSFRAKRNEPTVTVNGREAKLVAFEDEQTSFVPGVIEGAKKSLGEAFDYLGKTAGGILSNLVPGGGIALVGGAALLLISKTMGLGAGLGAALGAIASPITLGTLGAAAIALFIIALSGAIKGGSAALQNAPKMETIAAVTHESNQLNAQQPPSQAPTPPSTRPAEPQQPQPPFRFRKMG